MVIFTKRIVIIITALLSINAAATLSAKGIAGTNTVVESHLNVTVSVGDFMDQTDINFIAAALPGHDFYDADKWYSANGVPTLYTLAGTDKLAINSLPSLTNTVAVPMGLRPGSDGTFTLTFTDIESFPQTSMLYLEDTFLATFTDLRQTNTYVFSALQDDAEERFIIHFQPGLVFSVVNQSCSNTGSFTFSQAGETVWDSFYVKDNGGAQYAQGLNYGGDTITVSNLAPQEYILTLVHSSGYVTQQFITVGGQGFAPITITVAANDTTLNLLQTVTLTANLSGATNYTWDFGDGNTAPGTSPITHQYTVGGTYTVTLTASNDSCQVSESLQLEVSNTTALLDTPTDSPAIYGNGQHLVINFANWAGPKADLFMYNALGQRVESFTGIATAGGRTEWYLPHIKPGYYFVQLSSNGKLMGKKLYLGSN